MIDLQDKNHPPILECSKELGEIYRQTKEGNGQKWLMLDLQDKGGLYRDALRLAALRAAK